MYLLIEPWQMIHVVNSLYLQHSVWLSIHLLVIVMLDKGSACIIINMLMK